jgi:hypothetical protein
LNVSACDLQHIERELHHHVPRRRFHEEHLVAELRAQLRVGDRKHAIDGESDARRCRWRNARAPRGANASSSSVRASRTSASTKSPERT